VNVNVNPANRAPNTPAPNTVTFDVAGAFAVPQTIALTTVGDTTFGPSALAITGTVAIDGSTAPGLTIARASSASALRLFYVASTGNLTLNDLTLSGGLISAPYSGGGLYNSGTVALTDDTLTNNSAAGGLGGGLYNSGTATLTGDTLTNNSAGGGGG